MYGFTLQINATLAEIPHLFFFSTSLSYRNSITNFVQNWNIAFIKVLVQLLPSCVLFVDQV